MSAVWDWAKDHWQVLTSAVMGMVMGILIAVRVRCTKVPVAPQPAPGPLPDPTPALGPIKVAEGALDAADAATRAGGAAVAADTQGGHDAIDGATSLGAVDAVLYGREHAGVGGGAAPAADGGARAPDGGDLPHR
jgi:hypothetical protein